MLWILSVPFYEGIQSKMSIYTEITTYCSMVLPHTYK